MRELQIHILESINMLQYMNYIYKVLIILIMFLKLSKYVYSRKETLCGSGSLWSFLTRNVGELNINNIYLAEELASK